MSSPWDFLLTYRRFLWVFFQLEEICDAPSDISVREILREFSEGLAATYDRILGRLGKAKNKVPSKVFKWVAYAQRLLQLGELQEAISHEATDKSWHDAAETDGDRLIRSCGSGFAHHTVLKNLLSGSQEAFSFGFYLDFARANTYAGGICMAYLCFSDFESSVASKVALTEFKTLLRFR